ncbi:hypothetical protein CSUI_003575 [Cystoisospora suis]|uniref:Uncharacterized protein n=1 Tax=Cystoisospora suis TaxID=483139 RepID=A0A2C6KEZ2_9APIC|nr:hypothetical protein CSUI_003575 [Cystoisospora suis]
MHLHVSSSRWLLLGPSCCPALSFHGSHPFSISVLNLTSIFRLLIFPSAPYPEVTPTIMTSIRERQADHSQLLGRSRAERLLDGIYQRQKRYLAQRRRRAATEAANRIILPEEKRRRILFAPSDSTPSESPREKRRQQKGAAGKADSRALKSSGPKSVEEAVRTLQRHLWKRSKFDKAVRLLQQLWKTHFSTGTKRFLLAGLLTAASTDSCITSSEGRADMASFFREDVEPLLQRERVKSQRQADLLDQIRAQRTKVREAVLNQHLQKVVLGSQTGKRSTGNDAGKRATVAAVALAAAEAKDREEARQKQKADRKRNADDLAPSAHQEGEADEHREGMGDSQDEVCLTEQEKDLLEVLHLRCKTHLLLFTDDAFQFNQQIAELRKTIDAMIESSMEGHEEDDEEEGDEEEADSQEDEELPVRSEGQNGTLGQTQDGEGTKEVSREACCPSNAQSLPSSSRVEEKEVGREGGRNGHASDVSAKGEDGENALPWNIKSEETFETSGTGVQGSLPSTAAKSEKSSESTACEIGELSASAVKTEVEDNEDPAVAEFDEPLEVKWPLPLKKSELRNLLHCFLMECLATVFSYRNQTWARASIEQLFQHIYLNRSILSASDQGQAGLWQAQLKAPQKVSANVTALSIGEASVPVQDGRDERISTVHGSVIWSAKQMGC